MITLRTYLTEIMDPPFTMSQLEFSAKKSYCSAEVLIHIINDNIYEPSRDIIWIFCYECGLTIDEIQSCLSAMNQPELDVNSKRDSIIIKGIIDESEVPDIALEIKNHFQEPIRPSGGTTDFRQLYELNVKNAHHPTLDLQKLFSIGFEREAVASVFRRKIKGERLTVEKFAEYSCLKPDTVRHILNGNLADPSRDNIIMIGLGLELNASEIDYLLSKQWGRFNRYNERDVLIKNAIEQGKSVIEIHNLLKQYGLKGLDNINLPKPEGDIPLYNKILKQYFEEYKEYHNNFSMVKLAKAAAIDYQIVAKYFHNKIHPDRDHILSMCIVMERNIDEVNALLEAATLPEMGNTPRDEVIIKCIDTGIWDIHEINTMLKQMDNPSVYHLFPEGTDIPPYGVALNRYFERYLEDNPGFSKAKLSQSANVDYQMVIRYFASAVEPDRDKLLAICLALHLDEREINEVLLTARRRSLSRSDYRDMVIINCIERKIYSIKEINKKLARHAESTGKPDVFYGFTILYSEPEFN